MKFKNKSLLFIGFATIALLTACSTNPKVTSQQPKASQDQQDLERKVDPNQMDHWHVVSQRITNGDFLIGAHNGLYQTSNSVDWYKAATGLDGLDVMGIIQSSINPNKLMIGGHGFLKLSNDAGKTWSDLNQGLPKSLIFIF